MALASCPGAPRAAAELAQDAPGLELGVGAFAGGAEPGMSPVGLFLRGGLVLLAVRSADAVFAEVAPSPPRTTRPQAASSAMMPQIRGGQVMHGAGQRPGHPHDVAVRAGDDLQVHPVLAVLAGIERPVGGDSVDWD